MIAEATMKGALAQAGAGRTSAAAKAIQPHQKQTRAEVRNLLPPLLTSEFQSA